MKINLAVLVVIPLCMASSIVQADCTYPKGPIAIPKAKSATEAEMLEAMVAFKQYNSDVDTYVECLNAETRVKIKESGAASSIVQIKAIQAKKKSVAIDELKSKVEAFNQAVREFKDRS
ncbi:MAG: hypothetical protein AB7F79_07270 [Steroidobacteraceae bacterium]